MDTRRLVPRASGTIELLGPERTREAIAVLSDDRALRAQICERVRQRGCIPLSIQTPLDAVVTLERATPRTAIVGGFAFGLAAHDIVDFLTAEYPALRCVILAPVVDPPLAARVFACVRDLDDLELVLEAICEPRPAAMRALVVIAHASWRRAVCDCLAELGWESYGVVDLDAAARAANRRFDVAVLDDGIEDIGRLRVIAPGLPAIVLSESRTPRWATSNTVVASPTFAAISTALGAALSAACGVGARPGSALVP